MGALAVGDTATTGRRATDRARSYDRPVLTVDHDTGRAALLGELERFVRVVGAAGDSDLLAASRCHGWTVLDVVVHVRVGLQEMLGGVVATTDRRPDRDAATYWTAFPPGDADAVDGILWTRRTASAYRRPSGAMEHLRMVADAVRAAVTRMPDGAVSFQGHVLTSGDLLTTWAVELAVHHLDLGRDLDVAPPTAASLRLARATVEALAGAPLPAAWSDLMCVLVGTGRAALNAEARAAAGPAAGMLPVLG
ncbi:MAG: hypothetical protein BGP03_13685 [Pseudonocardia sp. 73-21]|nr:MAG: hypothetical protein BGP03_13685 [Pseudonocardia sp. 73-21]